MFLTLFGTSVRTTLFPEISDAAAKGKQSIAPLIEDGLAYEGLILIPGFIGGVLLAERLLAIYGQEFIQGQAVLWILILAVLLKGYQSQLLNALNGVDRPEISFKIYTVFILVNIVLNVLLISIYGWVGAAYATAISAGVGLVLSYVALRQVVPFSPPLPIIFKQIVAAMIMGIFVRQILQIIETTNIIYQNIYIVSLLVSLGAGCYFVVLLAISGEFRNTVARNLPNKISKLFSNEPDSN